MIRRIAIEAAAALLLAQPAHAGYTTTIDKNATFHRVDICRQHVEIINGETLLDDPCYDVVITRGGGTINVWFERKTGDSISFVIDREAPPYTNGSTRVLVTRLLIDNEMRAYGGGQCKLSLSSNRTAQILVCGTVVSSTKDGSKLYVGGSALVPLDFQLR